jgi:hypothetical protein
MAAVLQRSNERNGDHAASASHGGRLLFGSGLDPREHGSRGGKAAAASRRFREVRKIEDDILASSNGAAKAAVLRIRLERQATVERERVRLDRKIQEREELLDDLDEQAEDQRETIAQLQEDADRVEERGRLLREAVDADEAALLDRLRALHEADGLTPLLVALDLFDVVEEGEPE